MIINGTIQMINQSPASVDTQTGDPIPATEVAGEEIGCNLKVNNQSNNGRYEGGTFTQATYEILIENQSIEGKRLRLKNYKGDALGDFTIQSIQHLTFTNRIKITV